MDRRTFLKSAAVAGSYVILNPAKGLGRYNSLQTDFFAIHPFIENNPDAVFIMKTNVDTKYNSDAIKNAGLNFGRSVFTTTDDESKGFSLDKSFAIKPNLTSRGSWQAGYTVEGTMGVITDANFVEGTIESMKERGIAAENIHLREVNGTENMTDGGYKAMADRTGADVQVINNRPLQISADDIQWKDVPGGVWFNEIPFLAPFGSDDTWALNISKFKTHSMGVTLCAKNIQGSISAGYQTHCWKYLMDWGNNDSEKAEIKKHLNTDAWDTIKDNYDRHVADGIPRWNTPGWDHNGGLGMETWANRCLDNNSVNKFGLHVVEGVYGRDGHFVIGPNDGFAKDYMTNIIIFGKNAFHVDNIGHWLAGHEPGNFGLFHLAKERGLSSILNPMDIPIYEWKSESDPELTPLTEFTRTLLKCNYLKQDGEETWHLVNEPFNYPTTSIDNKITKPESFVLMQNYPNPFNPTTSIQFNLIKSGPVRMEIFNSVGKTVDVLTDKYYQRGSHLVTWSSRNLPSGTYFYRLRTSSFSETKKMLLIK